MTLFSDLKIIDDDNDVLSIQLSVSHGTIELPVSLRLACTTYIRSSGCTSKCMVVEYMACLCTDFRSIDFDVAADFGGNPFEVYYTGDAEYSGSGLLLFLLVWQCCKCTACFAAVP